MKRRRTKEVCIGGLSIGGGSPIVVQSMTKTKTQNVEATLGQIGRLEEAGCQMVRVAVPDKEAAEAIAQIKPRIKIPLVADIHFDYRLALLSIKNGADKIRINPGNIQDKGKLKEIVAAAKAKGIPIRIGVNSGSLPSDLHLKYGGVTSKGLVEAALRYVKLMEGWGFEELVLSLKSSDLPLTIEANREISSILHYPLHLGITEAGLPRFGAIKSAVGIGTLLAEGIGDTIRVSLTSDPIEEVKVGRAILRSLDIIKEGPVIISCPTCGRCEIDVVEITNEVEQRLRGIKNPLKVAVMGCVVNGPGEAREADVGMAGGKGSGLIFRKGKAIRKVEESKIIEALVDEVKKLC
jgi:(E)-4-hydroxy-3-methylbut-2-enyl-diphosphate synthase